MTQPLFVDTYPGDRPCDWAEYINAGLPWHGAIFKLSQGMHLEYAAWVHRQRFLFLASPRWKHDLFDGFYHYLDLGGPGAKQAEWFCHLAEQVGGECLPGMVDVERGGQSISSPSRQLVVDCTSSFAVRYEQLTGRKATLYGGELLRSVGVTDRLGCGKSAVAAYGSELRYFNPHTGKYYGTTEEWLASIGTDLEHLMLWQYRGTDPQLHGPAGYPMTAPGCGPIDISACTLPGGLDALRSLLAT